MTTNGPLLASSCKKGKKGYFMQECGGSSLKTAKNDNHGYQIGLGKFRIMAKKKSGWRSGVALFFHQLSNHVVKSCQNVSYFCTIKTETFSGSFPTGC